MVDRRVFCVVLIAVLILTAGHSAAATASDQAPKVDIGDLNHGKDHVRWPAPESLVKNLYSDDDQTRLHAIVQITASKEPLSQYFQTPSEVELRYAALGTSQVQQAIVAIAFGPYLFGAVGAKENGVWTRISSFSCWCKYERGDLLANFVQVEDGPGGGSELVLHANGGGTGIYTQHEARFRYYHGELHLVIAFMSRYQTCNPTLPGPYTCELEQRWFLPNSGGSAVRAVLAKTHYSFSPYRVPEITSQVRGMELSYARVFTCQNYDWDLEKFRYTKSEAPHPCKVRPPDK
jgi:hypothetical protein